MNIIHDMLSMIDPEHGIVLSDTLGLLGNSDFECSKKHLKVGDIHNYEAVKRGDYFTVLDEYSCQLFDEYVTMTGLIIDDSNEIKTDCIFMLKDYKVSDEFNILFEEDSARNPAIIAYTGELYTNHIDLANKYKFDPSMKLRYAGAWSFILELRGKIYISHLLDHYNKIYYFREKK